MSHQVRRLLPALVGLLLSACASAPKAPEFEPPVYPAPPDEPRFIFEETLRYSTNVEAQSAASKLRRYATGESAETRGLVKPYDVATWNHRAYITDTVQRRIIMFDFDGGHYNEFGIEGPGELSKPTGIDVATDGEVYVADVAARRISVFDAEGKFLRYIGSKKQFLRPADVTLSPDGSRVYVIDTGGVESQDHRMYIFDSQSGELLATIGTRGRDAGQFNLPLQLAAAPDGSVYVVDKGNFRVEHFDADGKYLGQFGTVGRYPGQFFSPKGIAVDKDGNVYVVDTAFGNVQIFNGDGELLMVMGQRGQSSAPGNYMLPAGIDVDSEGRVYIVDQFFRKVDIYRPISLETPLRPTDKN